MRGGGKLPPVVPVGAAVPVGFSGGGSPPDRRSYTGA